MPDPGDCCSTRRSRQVPVVPEVAEVTEGMDVLVNILRQNGYSILSFGHSSPFQGRKCLQKDAVSILAQFVHRCVRGQIDPKIS